MLKMIEVNETLIAEVKRLHEFGEHCKGVISGMEKELDGWENSVKKLSDQIKSKDEYMKELKVDLKSREKEVGVCKRLYDDLINELKFDKEVNHIEAITCIRLIMNMVKAYQETHGKKEHYRLKYRRLVDLIRKERDAGYGLASSILGTHRAREKRRKAQEKCK